MTITTEEAEALAEQAEAKGIEIYANALRALTVERDTAVNAARLAAQIGHEWKDRAERAETARDEAISQLSGISRELGEAEGRLAASEMAGIVEGWKARAERAEAAAHDQEIKHMAASVGIDSLTERLEKAEKTRERAEAEAEKLREALVETTDICHQCLFEYILIKGRYVYRKESVARARAALEGGKDADQPNEALKARQDAERHGTGILLDGKRVPPEDFFKSPKEMASDIRNRENEKAPDR